MRQKLTLKIVLVTIALTGAYLVLRSATPANKPDTCTETESMDNCKKQNSGGGVIWENISHQFFSSF